MNTEKKEAVQTAIKQLIGLKEQIEGAYDTQAIDTAVDLLYESIELESNN